MAKEALTRSFGVGLNPINGTAEKHMRSTQQLSITLPTEMAEAIKSKVATGEYATESEVIRDGLRALLARDRAVENWLHTQVGPAYDALKADRSRAVTAEGVRKRLAAEHKTATLKK
jgi:antitoxin ParD1/3/4